MITSQLVTSGGSKRNSASTRSSAAGSAYSGCCRIGRERHDSGDQTICSSIFPKVMKFHGITTVLLRTRQRLYQLIEERLPFIERPHRHPLIAAVHPDIVALFEEALHAV